MSRVKALTALVVLVSSLALVQQGVSADFQSSVTATVAISTGTTGASVVSLSRGDPTCGPDGSVCTSTGDLNADHLTAELTMSTNATAYEQTFTFSIENTGTLPLSVSLTGGGGSTDPMGTAMTVSSAGNPDISLADFTAPTQLTLPDHLAGGASVDYDLTFSAPSFSPIFCTDCSEPATQEVDVQVTMSWVEASSPNTVPH